MKKQIIFQVPRFVVLAKLSISNLFGAFALGVAIAQAVLFGCAVNGVHINPRVGSIVGVLTTAVAWLARSPFAKQLGLDKTPPPPDDPAKEVQPCKPPF